MQSFPTDDELVFLARQKHEEAIQYLIEKMKQKQDRLIFKMLAKHLYCGLDYDDLKMVAMQSLFQAIESYHPARNVFDAYYHFLMQRELVNELKRFASIQHAPINQAFSLDYEIEDGTTMADLIGEEDSQIKQPLDDPFHQLLESTNTALTPQEIAMITYVKQGYSYSEIGRLMGISYRVVSRIVQQLLNQGKKQPGPLYD